MQFCSFRFFFFSPRDLKKYAIVTKGFFPPDIFRRHFGQLSIPSHLPPLKCKCCGVSHACSMGSFCGKVDEAWQKYAMVEEEDPVVTAKVAKVNAVPQTRESPSKETTLVEEWKAADCLDAAPSSAAPLKTSDEAGSERASNALMPAPPAPRQAAVNSAAPPRVFVRPTSDLPRKKLSSGVVIADVSAFKSVVDDDDLEVVECTEVPVQHHTTPRVPNSKMKRCEL